MSINCLHITSPQTLSSVTKTTPRHIPYTFQTPHRYSEAHGREGTSWPKWIKSNFYQFISHYTPHHPIPPQTIYKKSLRQPQTPPRHLPGTLQTSQNRALNGQSRVIETSQFKQYPMFLHWIFINWFGMRTPLAFFRVTQTITCHLPDTVKSIDVGVVKGISRKGSSWM